ncbi:MULTISPECIES: PQQ-binding-like beta-propeller repeat protein [unclassified Methanosarcina]|uniref:PQQ-binding-like beta-propeller repeat protein n=1 Tax=unclassified Methanosarcina TaxID=2644672 RepID=UPI00061619C3|nr:MULTISPECIES: PQQ-binding-like beta-propeller repeat protein [unclassified Methanosarcina]AKB19880.1 Serine/threonine protein kinase related protein [Methanosarcina sp. WWM596]AKB22350.1 Serine/threonine protein kinase related protein [Methanosarcina sp. WH1]
MKRFCIKLFLFVFLFASVSTASASEIVLDTEPHHLGDNFKEKLNPDDPEGPVYTATFTLGSVDIRSAELRATVKNIVLGPTDEFLDKVYLNEIEIGAINNYIPAGTPDDAEMDIEIPVHPTLFNPGNNTIKISSGSNADGSNYDDFEFYNLTLHLSEAEPITLEPPLKVAWTYELPWKLGYEIPPGVTLAADGILYIGREDFGDAIIIALDAETGTLLWSKEWSDGLSVDMGYKDGVLFVVYSSNIDALDAKTGKILWSKEYSDIWWGNPVAFGDTLFVNTPRDRYVSAIDTENGALKWEYELNVSDAGTNGRVYELSKALVNGNCVVFGYKEWPDDEGIIALNAHTGDMEWEFVYPGKILNLEPFLYKDLIYASRPRSIIALSVESGEEVWKTNNWGFENVIEVTDGKLFVGFSNPSVLKPETGEILNEYSYSNVSFFKAVIGDKFIYCTNSSSIQFFDSSTGELVWGSSRIKGYDVSKPLLYKDKLYLVSTEGTLYAFEHGEEGMFFTKGLESSASYYFPQVAIAAMLILLVILLIKMDNRVLVFGSWLIALTGVIFLSIKAIEPYNAGLGFGFFVVFVFLFMFVIFLFGIAFLMYGIRKRRQL